MYIVSMLSQKGGTGKTTLSLHLAVASETAGKRVVVIDLDPQASSAEWKDSRESDTPVVVPIPATRLPQALQAAREGNADLVRIPRESCHPFHTKVATDSTQNLPLIP